MTRQPEYSFDKLMGEVRKLASEYGEVKQRRKIERAKERARLQKALEGLQEEEEGE